MLLLAFCAVLPTTGAPGIMCAVTPAFGPSPLAAAAPPPLACSADSPVLADRDHSVLFRDQHGRVDSVRVSLDLVQEDGPSGLGPRVYLGSHDQSK